MTSSRKLNIGIAGGGVISVDIAEPFDFKQHVMSIRSTGYLLVDAVYVTADAIQWIALTAPENAMPIYMGTRQ